MGFKPGFLAAAITALMLAACDGDDGRNGTNGVDGVDGSNGAPGMDGAPGSDGSNGVNSLVIQTSLPRGSEACFYGGIQIDSGLDTNNDGALTAEDGDIETSFVCGSTPADTFNRNFNRIATFAACDQEEIGCFEDNEAAAEIVAASTDGMTLIYTGAVEIDDPEAEFGALGFIDITNPSNPVGNGLLPLSGEPTSVAVAGDYALAGVNTSADFINTSGSLEVVDIATQSIVASLDLGGQPDSVAVSPSGNYAVVVIENERDEDLGDGFPPQAPAGFLVVVDLTGEPTEWTTRTVDLTGLDGVEFPGDPEPEYVDINDDDIAVVTLQENNAIVLVDLANTEAPIVNSFSVGSVDLEQIDNDNDGVISLTESATGLLRQPDGVTWLSSELFVTANEGDLDTRDGRDLAPEDGGRSFTVFNTNGDVVFEAGNQLDHLATRFGHFPDERADDAGNEPENAEFGVFGNERFLFVNSERSSLIFVYDVADFANPVFKQALPAVTEPEGVLAIPSRNLLVAASEEDDRGAFRGGINVYRYATAQPQYPTIHSTERLDGTPIPWGAMSGLAEDLLNPNVLYAVEDSFYNRNRIFKLDISHTPALLAEEINIVDTNGVFAAIDTVVLDDASVDDDDASRVDVFDEADLAALINDDNTVNIDPEGVAVANDGGFWVVSEGSGTVGDSGRPVNSLNFLIKTDANGVIENVATLPADLNAVQRRFGFEGVAVDSDGIVYVTFQREWDGEDMVRIGAYDPTAEADPWQFFFYPLDAVESPNGGWVGLSDIAALGGGQFLILERDNQGGPDAAIKRIYLIDVFGDVDPFTGELGKLLVRDLIGDLAQPNGQIPEKVEGLALTNNGDVWIVNDNDGVDDNSGETQLLNLGTIFLPQSF